MNRILPLLFVTLIALAPAASADWALDSEASSLGFVSIKNGMAVESHHFKSLAGSINNSGKANLRIKLDSVETMIPIRNERMREMLFKTDAYPEATVSVDLDMAKLGRLKAGEALTQEIAANVRMVGQTATVMANVTVVRGHNSVVVSTQKPLVINAGDWGLVPGLESLREVAMLSSITPAVPVTFTLKFNRVEK